MFGVISDRGSVNKLFNKQFDKCFAKLCNGSKCTKYLTLTKWGILMTLTGHVKNWQLSWETGMRMQYTATGTALNVYLVTMEQLSTTRLEWVGTCCWLQSSRDHGLVDYWSFLATDWRRWGDLSLNQRIETMKTKLSQWPEDLTPSSQTNHNNLQPFAHSCLDPMHPLTATQFPTLSARVLLLCWKLKERDFPGCVSGRPHGSFGAVLCSTVWTTWMGIPW